MVLPDGHARDLLIAGLVVGGILLSLYAYTGNWPPPVVIESNSMMHVDADEYEQGFGDTRPDGLTYGRLGTIDPGDLVLVKEAGSPDEVETYADDGEEHYGLPGEVIVYYRWGNDARTPIIHRAMTYIELEGEPSNSPTYRVRWSPQWEEQGRCTGPADERICTFGSEGVTIPALGIKERRFQHSGFITKGDNVVGNRYADQRLGIIEQPVRMEWVQGVARGELPWFGLIKLSLTDPLGKNLDMSSHPYFWTIGKMTAPQDLWVMLGVGLVVVGGLPVGLDYAVHRIRVQREGRDPSDAPPHEPDTYDDPPPPTREERPEERPKPTSSAWDPDASSDEEPGRVNIELE